MSRQIFLDTETTGLSPESGDRIIEIGCVEMINRRLTGRHLHFYINPERPNHEDAVRIHGLTDEFLADKPVFAALVDEILDYCRGAEIIIHNAALWMMTSAPAQYSTIWSTRAANVGLSARNSSVRPCTRTASSLLRRSWLM